MPPPRARKPLRRQAPPPHYRSRRPNPPPPPAAAPALHYMAPVRSQISLALALGSTARIIAARLRMIDIWISCVQRRMNDFASVFAPALLVACSEAKRKVLVTAGCGLPSAVHTNGRYTIPAAASSEMAFLYLRSFRANAAAAASPRALVAFGEAIHTSRAALHPGTAAIV